MGLKTSFKRPKSPTVMKVGRQRIPDSRSRHWEATARTSQTGAGYNQAHSGAGRAKCPVWRVLTDHGAHVGRCIISVHGLIEEAHHFMGRFGIRLSYNFQLDLFWLHNSKQSFLALKSSKQLWESAQNTWEGKMWHTALKGGRRGIHSQ